MVTHVHKVKLLDGKITVNDEVEVIIDKQRRKEIEANHSSVIFYIMPYNK